MTPNQVTVRTASWSVVLGWAVLIFYASEQSDLGVGVPLPFLDLLPQWTWQWLFHGLVFGVLTALTYLAMRLTVSWPPLVVAVAAVAVATAYGALDEWHQSFVPGRSATLSDVGRDAFGAVAIVSVSHAASLALAHLAAGRWLAFGRLSFATLVTLQGAWVIWMTSLWMSAGAVGSFSLASLSTQDFEDSLLEFPVAYSAGLPYLATGLWIALGRAKTLMSQAVLALAPSASAVVAFGVPFLVFGLDILPDRRLVWVGAWLAMGGAWFWGMSLIAVRRLH